MAKTRALNANASNANASNANASNANASNAQAAPQMLSCEETLHVAPLALDGSEDAAASVDAVAPVDAVASASSGATANDEADCAARDSSSSTSASVTPSVPDVQRALAAREVQLLIPSSAEYVRVVRLAVLGVASRMPFSYDDVEDIKLAVSEACNNAILHAAGLSARPETQAPAAQTPIVPGNEDAGSIETDVFEAGVTSGAATAETTSETDNGASVLIIMTPWPDRLEITVADEGYVPPPGLSARVPALPRTTPEGLRESGLGLFLMQTLMDRVEHGMGADSNTIVRLVKFLPRPAPAPS